MALPPVIIKGGIGEGLRAEVAKKNGNQGLVSLTEPLFDNIISMDPLLNGTYGADLQGTGRLQGRVTGHLQGRATGHLQGRVTGQSYRALTGQRSYRAHSGFLDPSM